LELLLLLPLPPLLLTLPPYLMLQLLPALLQRRGIGIAVPTTMPGHVGAAKQAFTCGWLHANCV
jgi:hypothetical protein